eukprot:c5164_g1_i1.p1 GENE.c5164_g1_i1~~c5164_g1_i1.p1  ORF type:complete len:426 (-),score=66.42 c5164_g1_i1:49-1326(-)
MGVQLKVTWMRIILAAALFAGVFSVPLTTKSNENHKLFEHEQELETQNLLSTTTSTSPIFIVNDWRDALSTITGFSIGAVVSIASILYSALQTGAPARDQWVEFNMGHNIEYDDEMALFGRLESEMAELLDAIPVSEDLKYWKALSVNQLQSALDNVQNSETTNRLAQLVLAIHTDLISLKRRMKHTQLSSTSEIENRPIIVEMLFAEHPMGEIQTKLMVHFAREYKQDIEKIATPPKGSQKLMYFLKTWFSTIQDKLAAVDEDVRDIEELSGLLHHAHDEKIQIRPGGYLPDPFGGRKRLELGLTDTSAVIKKIKQLDLTVARLKKPEGAASEDSLWWFPFASSGASCVTDEEIKLIASAKFCANADDTRLKSAFVRLCQAPRCLVALTEGWLHNGCQDFRVKPEPVSVTEQPKKKENSEEEIS